MPWFSYELCKGFIIKTCEQCVNSINAPNIVLFVSRLALHWNLIRLRTGTSAFACLDVYFPALKCLIKTYRIPISEIAFSRVRCESLFGYIGSDWPKSDIRPSESPNAAFQTLFQDLWVTRSIKHGLKHPKNKSNTRITEERGAHASSSPECGTSIQPNPG
jgi:hypothetical protein